MITEQFSFALGGKKQCHRYLGLNYCHHADLSSLTLWSKFPALRAVMNIIWLHWEPFRNRRWSFLSSWVTDYKRPLESVVTGSMVNRNGSIGSWSRQFAWHLHRQGKQVVLQIFLLVRCALCCLRCFCWLLDFGLSPSNGYNTVENCDWYKCLWPSPPKRMCLYRLISSWSVWAYPWFQGVLRRLTYGVNRWTTSFHW